MLLVRPDAGRKADGAIWATAFDLLMVEKTGRVPLVQFSCSFVEGRQGEQEREREREREGESASESHAHLGHGAVGTPYGPGHSSQR